MRKIYIYCLKDPISNEIRYVGKTTEPKRRLNAHIARSKNSKYHSARWVSSILKKKLKPVLAILEECDESNWVEREKFWIQHYRRVFDLTNILDGGDGGATFGRLGKPWDDKQREANRKARLGVPVKHSKEGNENRNKGRRKFFDENKKPVLQYSVGGEFIQEWPSAVDAGSGLNINHSNITRSCKSDMTKISGGYLWKHKIINN